MKLKDYNTINNYIYDKIDTNYLLLNDLEKFNKMYVFIRDICEEVGYSFSISHCNNYNILFSTYSKSQSFISGGRKWFNFDVKKLLIRKRKMKLDKIISLIE